MLKKSFVCPFCFEKIRISEVEYRCCNGWCEARDEIDEIRGHYLFGMTNVGGNVRAGHVLPAKPGGLGLRASEPPACDVCHQPTVRICPHCHSTLPDSTVAGADNIISVIGTRSSGKSVYIGVLINEMMKRLAPSFDATMQGFVDMCGLYDADKLYRDNKYGPLYEEQRTLDLTRTHVGGKMSRLADDQDKIPLVYRFAYIEDKLGRHDDFTLAFFDSAGEDQQNPKLASTAIRYIGHSKGIIFLIDPLQIPEVLDQVQSTTGERAYSTGLNEDEKSVSPNIVLANITALIKQSLGIRGKKKIDIPVAIAFSKIDTVKPIVPNGLTLFQPSPHCSAGAFVSSDAQQVDAEMRALLQQWGQQSLITAIQADYRDYAFFGISSLGLGNEPDASRKIKKPHPHRIEDPMLWLMSKNKLLSKLKE